MIAFAFLLAFGWTAAVADHPASHAGSDVIELARGSSEVLNLPTDLSRVAVANPAIADVIVLSPREILVNARAIGRTTLIVWDANDVHRTYDVDVTIDVAALNRQFEMIFPGEGMEARAAGTAVVLTGFVSGAVVARRMVEVARATGATVIEHYVCVRPSVYC